MQVPYFRDTYVYPPLDARYPLRSTPRPPTPPLLNSPNAPVPTSPVFHQKNAVHYQKCCRLPQTLRPVVL